MEKRICNKCKVNKNIDKFPFKNKLKNIKHGSCLECWKEIRKESYEKNKSVTLKRNKKNIAKTREWYHEYKSTLKCSKCSENHPACLEFHHRDSSTKDQEVSIMLRGTISKENLMKEIEKCDVLCSNCHKKHHYNERMNNKK
jgi:hypothetical protein